MGYSLNSHWHSSKCHSQVSFPGVDNRERGPTGIGELKDQGDKDMRRILDINTVSVA